MPELPEVEIMTRNLRLWSKKSIIHWVRVHRQNGRYLPGEELECLKDRTISDVFRLGKQIVFVLTNNPIACMDENCWIKNFKSAIGPPIVYMVCHNAMSGFWDLREQPWTFDYVEGSREASERDVRVEINMGTFTLRFHDARLFGSLRAYTPGQQWKAPEVPEALKTECSPDFVREITADEIRSFCRGKMGKLPIKQLLMEQHLVAGIGNIYAAEALYLAKVDPRIPGKDVPDEKFPTIHNAIKQVLQKALECKLDYTQYLHVYRQPICMFCSGKIQKVDIKGRSTYFCGSCQS